jgi:hypothetical protein
LDQGRGVGTGRDREVPLAFLTSPLIRSLPLPVLTQPANAIMPL